MATPAPRPASDGTYYVPVVWSDGTVSDGDLLPLLAADEFDVDE